VSDSSGAWFHCARCGALFRASAVPDERGPCPDCGGDPVSGGETGAPAPVRIRRKVRKPREGAGKSKRHRHRKRKARALMIFVIAWGLLLGLSAIAMKRIWPDARVDTSVVDEVVTGGQAMEDARLIQDQLSPCGSRLRSFLAASDIGGRSPHVLRADSILPEMARALRHEPIFASTEPLTVESYAVVHTPAGRAIETMWKREDGKRVEAVFFEENGEWKIDWHAFTRASSEPWAQFLSGKGKGEGTFRVLARERIGANGRDPRFIGLVLYAPRPGHPGEAVSPSPEIRVERGTPEGRLLEEAFAARQNGLGPFGSRLVAEDPDDMIRLHVRLTREGEDERIYQITELLACHWMELPAARE
jgi:hypothetical protein